jgi:glycosyltransferase involved in cell wall biosynthesis
MAASLPVLDAAAGADVVYFEAAYVPVELVNVLELLPPKLVMCTGSDVRIMPDRSPWIARAMPAVFAQMGRVLCRSEDLRTWAVQRGAPSERTAVLYPAVDTAYFAPSPRPARPGDALRLVAVGRQHWVKAYEHAVHAVALARSDGHDVTLTIVGGDSGSGDALAYMIRDLGLTEVVQLVGSRSVAGTRAALARSDVFIMSSLSEGVSRAALEAMAMGLPVITTDAGGMPEVVEDGVDGLIVPRRDPRALADAIGVLAVHADTRAAMGARARAKAGRFDTGPHLDRIERELTDLAGLPR